MSYASEGGMHYRQARAGNNGSIFIKLHMFMTNITAMPYYIQKVVILSIGDFRLVETFGSTVYLFDDFVKRVIMSIVLNVLTFLT